MKIFSRNMKFLSQIENIKIKIKNLLDEFNNRLEIAEEIIWWRHDNKVSKLMPIKEKKNDRKNYKGKYRIHWKYLTCVIRILEGEETE